VSSNRRWPRGRKRKEERSKRKDDERLPYGSSWFERLSLGDLLAEKMFNPKKENGIERRFEGLGLGHLLEMLLLLCKVNNNYQYYRD
jgi:hypothetical protein